MTSFGDSVASSMCIVMFEIYIASTVTGISHKQVTPPSTVAFTLTPEISIANVFVLPTKSRLVTSQLSIVRIVTELM